MKPTFTDYQQQIEGILAATYGIETTLEMRNHISFCYHFAGLKPPAVVLEILVEFR